MRHATENAAKDLLAVQDLEVRLQIDVRWDRESEEWKATTVLLTRRRYQRCLDELEGLIVSRMFELTKMNMSQTGYKLRRHIAKALSARSQAIRTSLERYNIAAAALTPPRSALSWDNVVEYAFLADFDLLRETREDIRLRPWAKPAARVAMDSFFKLERAREEIQRLNIEIRRVLTHMRDEDKFLRYKDSVTRLTDPSLAHQIYIHRMEKGRFMEIHRKRFSKLLRLPGFTGDLSYGVSIDRTLHEGSGDDMDVDDGVAVGAASVALGVADGDEGLDPTGEEEDDVDHDQDDEDRLAERFNVLALTLDEPVDGLDIHDTH